MMSEATVVQPDELQSLLYPVGVPRWYAMTSLDPQQTDAQLAEVNSMREVQGLSLFQRFIPYSFLKRRIANDNPEDESAKGNYFNPKNRRDVQANNQLRSILRRYIFIKASEADIEHLLTAAATAEQFRTLWFCHNKSRQRIIVPDKSMERFINACCDMRLQFEVWPAIKGLEKNEEVILNTTEFKGQHARVLEVRQVAGGNVELTVGFHIFDGTALVKLRHIRLKDVLSESKTASPATREANRYKFIEDTQRKVFTLMNRTTTSPTDKDIQLLEQLNSYRYRQFETPVLQAKYSALMLMCTVLSRDPYARTQFAERLETILQQLQAHPDDKRPRDIIAYVQSALYVATRHESYCDAAMTYYRSLPKLTATQRNLINFMRRSALFV